MIQYRIFFKLVNAIIDLSLFFNNLPTRNGLKMISNRLVIDHCQIFAALPEEICLLVLGTGHFYWIWQGDAFDDIVIKLQGNSCVYQHYFAECKTSFFRNHCGSLAFGAAIIAIVQLIRITLEYLDRKLKGNHSFALFYGFLQSDKNIYWSQLLSTCFEAGLNGFVIRFMNC